ncbi:Aspartic peptidase [Kalmanozyma brasiliensis GHG001]|uniref:Peptidase A1 domain-containing protein n=1 Tax=Kalmanozyma brasiliensis (strain GHG001) TaxID=1365824 RepID=V5E3N1_KALBG|nr:Aspartic peptidase [Kalmanozyma brasiliensis GHG001]EST04786.1 Aspartic peptidase [Kalmanozyma brasiliensis GHG001]
MKLAGATTLVSSGLLAASAVMAVPAPSISSPVHIPITKRNLVKRSGDDLLNWAFEQKAMLQSKYNLPSTSQPQRRAGAASLTNVQYDSSWVAPISGGTPSKEYYVVLDTGSADLWISDQYYTPSSSSSFQNDSSAFNIQYGSGSVSGYLATDTFSLAGTTVNNLHFAVADQVSQGLTSAAMEGIMGMGFQRLASSGEPPLWVASNQNTFSFYLERASLTSADQTQAGGIFTLGGTNSSLYQGDISYNSLIEELYWMVRLGAIGTKGSNVNLGSLTRAAIDTGTTLVGGPDSVVQSLYSQIPNSRSQGNGYYSFPCSSSVDATLTFNGMQYTIPDSDFIAGTLDNSGSQCLGAFFGLGSTVQTDLQWIVGDAFLKNVYSVFTTNGNNGNAAVGFASLANGLNSGTNSKSVGTSSNTSSSPAARSFGSAGVGAVALAVAVSALAAVLA